MRKIVATLFSILAALLVIFGAVICVTTGSFANAILPGAAGFICAFIGVMLIETEYYDEYEEEA
jgi:hypothetical protein